MPRPHLQHVVTHQYGIAISGPPATGKTTLLRDIPRILAQGIIIIGTSNEIAGQQPDTFVSNDVKIRL